MLSKQLRKVSCITLESLTNSLTTQFFPQFSKSPTCPTSRLVSEIRSLSSSDSFLNFSDFPWLNNSECLQNQQISNLLQQVQQKLNLSIEDDFLEISEKFKNSELFLLKCETLGIPEKEAKNLLTLLRIFNLQPPASFSHEEMTEVLQKVKRFSIHYREEYLNCLREQIKQLEKTLSPLKKKINKIKEQAHEFSAKSVKVVAATLISQGFGIAFFVFPEVQMVHFAGAGLVAAAGAWKVLEKTSGLRNSIFQYKFSKLVERNQIKVERIFDLQQEIDTIRNKVIELH
jgi:hypothetical protein